MESPNEKLLLAKYLYTRGSDVLRDGGLFDTGLAVSLFQDAVEMAVLSCAALVEAFPGDKYGFMGIWKATNDALRTASRPTLPMAIQMDSLNKARISFKHAGHVPEAALAEACRIDAGNFLVRVAKDYFDLEFLLLSLVTFVRDDEEKRLLEVALQRVASEDLQGALESCSDAMGHISRRRQSLYSHGIRVAMPNIDPAVRAHIAAEIGHIRQQVQQLEGLVFSQACGVPITDFLVLSSVLPRRVGDQVKFEALPPEAFSASVVRRCIDFLARYSIGLSRQARSPANLLEGWEWLILDR